ncbi:MAG TPA: glycosyltransferase family 4 protein [Acidimicrobiia bacterium]|jgi:phosphatidyl-myo-inositol alpha-mannosyltransferase|nr:glycosyltransferase family 4 protein [Acidimicrobiia bacterium]
MRVVLICPYSLSLPGGVQGQVLGLARTLRQRGVSATVLGPCDGPPPEPGVISVGPSVSLAANGSVAPLALDPPAIRRTLEALAATQPDVLHLHEPLVPGPALTALLAGNVPAVGTFHASGRVPAYVWLRPAVRAVARRIGLRTAVSPEARALAERWLGGACQVLPNGVEIERFAKAGELHLPPGDAERRAILFVGRHEPRKGLDVLLEAFRQLDRDAVLWVAGVGPNTSALTATAPPGVEWLGRISDQELAQRLRAATVFCAPSLHGESFGVILLEAMAAGTPVVASDISGYRDVARQDKEAVLVPGGDPAALAGGLRRVLDDATLAGRLVEAGTARAASFSMERLAGRYADLYETLLARTP